MTVSELDFKGAKCNVSAPVTEQFLLKGQRTAVNCTGLISS